MQLAGLRASSIVPAIALLAACADVPTRPESLTRGLSSPTLALETSPQVSIEQGPIDAGGGGTCAFRPDGTITCWGGFPYGQSIITNVTGLTQISLGFATACGLRPDGSIGCWGSDGSGQTNVVPGTYTQVSAGYYQACGLRTDRKVVCWGSNDRAQLELPDGEYLIVSAGQ